MKLKSEVLQHLKHFNKSLVEMQAASGYVALDLMEENFSNEFSNFMNKQGSQQQYSCRYTLQRNGMAERKN